MSIAAGTRLGPYEVVAKLGEGGMGEVYRAVDSDLKRAVAIKVLPDRVRGDPDRLARFQREAEILAALNHPHIAHIHGWLKTDDRVGLVMELVDGPTLADRIAAGRLAVDEALSIARQIALALETAHDRGIVHRDLKPANIKVRPDGHVKVLDFGLAKLIDSRGGADDPHPPSDSPTITVPLSTEAGAVVGTPAYMAPEQAKGSTVDRRADIWAFGCVLFEMLAGRRPFDALSRAETLAAVLGTEPDWSRLPDTVPAWVTALLRRCLVRDPQHRVSHIAVVLYAIGEGGSSVPSTVATPARGIWKLVVPAMLVSALVAGAATASVFYWYAAATAPSPDRVVRTTIAESTFLPDPDRTFAMTPDGTRLVYASADAREIRVRSLDTLDSVAALTTASYLRCLTTSPDGQWIGFVENNFTLKKIPILGGASATIVMMDGPSRGAAWGPDHTIVFATGSVTTGVQRVSADGGPVTVLTRPNRDGGEFDHTNPTWLPDGRGVLFTITARTGGTDAAKVALFDLASSTTRILIPGAYGARYVNGGFLVYAAAGSLWATKFDLDRREVQGSPVKVPALPIRAPHFDISANGTLVYPRGGREITTEAYSLVWVDRNGRETAIAVPPDNYRQPRLSPDGSRLAVSLRGDIYLLNPARAAAPFRLTSTPGMDWYPVWTPDSRRIVFGSWRGGGFSNVYVQDVDSATATRLTDSADMQLPQSMSPDGGTVIFNSFPKDLHALRLQPPLQVRTVVSSPLEERSAAVSPDGVWLAYEAETPSRPGVLDIFVQSFRDPAGGTWQVTNDGGMFPIWRRRGQEMELYYAKADGTLVALPVQANATTWRPGTPADLFRGPYFMFGDGGMGRHFDVAPDGRFLMVKETRDPAAEPAHFVVVQNWQVELQKLTSEPMPSGRSRQ